MKKIMFVIVMMVSGLSFAGDVHVKGHFKKDGTYVEPYERSAPNVYKWDNKSYEPSQPQNNDSYNKPNRDLDSNYNKPSSTRFQDNNPNNDYPSYNTGNTYNTDIHNKYKER